MTIRRSTAIVATVLAMVVGALLGWVLIGPLLVDRWALEEAPGSNHYSDYIFARDASMLVGAVVGSVAGVTIALTATRIVGWVSSTRA